jgi:Na+/H+ antiporter NhaC
MNQENQVQRQLKENEIYALEWRIRDRLKQGENPREVKQQLEALGLTRESAERFVDEIAKQESESKKEDRSNYIGQLVGIPIVSIGVLLVIGNRTGLFPTIPFAGFIVIILGIIVGGVLGYLASRTVK